MKLFYIIAFNALFLFGSYYSNAQQIFIKITSSSITIEGESTVVRHEKEIIALAFGQETNGCNPSQTGGGACVPTTSNFAFDMHINTATNGLRNAQYKGTHLETVEVTFAKPNGGGLFEYYKIKLANVLVTKITDATDGSSNINQVQFAAEKFFWTYTPQTGTGSPGTPVTFGWNLKTNSEWNGL